MKISKLSDATLRRLADEDPFPVVTAGNPRLLKTAKLKLVARDDDEATANHAEPAMLKQRAG